MAVDLLSKARHAVEMHDWNDAIEALSSAERSEALTGDDLMLYGDALWWTGQPDDAVNIFERAYGEFLGEGRVIDAATVGSLMAYLAVRNQNFAVGGGWMTRVEDLLDGQPESMAHVWLKILHVGFAMYVEHDWEKALGLTDEAAELARRFEVPGLRAMAMSFRGLILIQQGQWREGITLIDEATVVAMTEKGNLRFASDVYCNTIAASSNLGDYRRAGEWTEEAERWMKNNSLGGYTGVCQVHRAELKRLRGSWTEAEEEARRACLELERFHIMDGLGFAYYEIGEVRRQMGDYVAAEEAFFTAHKYGHRALPGLALLMFDRGDVEGAAKTINGALARLSTPTDATAAAKPGRGRLLPAQVEIALASGDLETARAAVEELEMIATELDGRAWDAWALSCRGALELEEGSVDDALDVLDQAWRLWQEIELPYESARARLLLGIAHQTAGDELGARLELGAARSALQELGAITDVRFVDELTGETLGPSAGVEPERVTKTFMFTDIVTSTDLIGLIGDDAWQKLLEWHDRTLRAEISSAGGQEVRHTGDGFFASFDDPRSGVEAAVAIQRKLREHRSDSGFAAQVRIGLHVAEATRRGSDYSGQGVHAAARVGALAEGEEIVVSTDVAAAAGNLPYPLSDPETVSLKGITEPVEVMRVDWR
jgi:class 3 adenylate cyclase